jgi:hypothetical protein
MDLSEASCLGLKYRGLYLGDITRNTTLMDCIRTEIGYWERKAHFCPNPLCQVPTHPPWGCMDLSEASCLGLKYRGLYPGDITPNTTPMDCIRTEIGYWVLKAHFCLNPLCAAHTRSIC